MLFISRQYRHSTAELGVSPAFVSGPPRREERVVVPVPGINRAVVQADQRRPVDRGRRPGRVHQRRPGRGGQGPRGVATHITGRAAGDRRVAVPRARRPAARLPGRPRRGLATRPRGAHHVRRAPRVRRPQLVGAAALQPVDEAAPAGPAWPSPRRSSSTCRIGGTTSTRKPRRRRSRTDRQCPAANASSGAPR